MKPFPQTRTEGRQIFPTPHDGATVEETPPCLAWLPLDGSPLYTVTLTRDGREIWRGETEKNYIIPDIPLEPGTYRWNLFTPDAERGEQSFTVSPDAVRVRRVTAEELLAAVPAGHPRHLFAPADIPVLLSSRKREIETLRRNLEEAYRDGLPERPMFHRSPDALPYREYFGRFRDFLDRDLVALSLGYALLGDEAAGAAARERLLTLCDWNPAGPCSLIGRYGDEVGLSFARCLPSVYDLLYSLLSPAERDLVAWTVAAYAEQCESRLRKLDFCRNPGNSHAGRLPAYLGEAALVLSDSGILPRETLLSWLSLALDIYSGIFPYYGGSDGGWAEGTFYSTSYTRWYLPFFCAVERYTGASFLARPFYQRLTQFFLHFANPDFENHPFGDGYWCSPDDPEWPGFFAQNPCRLYAARFGPEEAKRRAEAAASPDLFRLHLLDVFIPDGQPPETALTGEVRNFAVFPDTGLLSMHTDLLHTGQDFACLVRASRFGSDSHRHPDQGSFALFFRGVSLISPSGYFGRRYGTKHHLEWLNSTRAHNAPLIGGEGQYPNSHLAVGEILSTSENDGVMTAVISAGSAYPGEITWHRTFVLSGRTLTVTDEISSPVPLAVTYPLHFLSRPEKDGNDLLLTRRGVSLRVTPLEGGLSSLSVTDRFAVGLNEGEPSAYHVTMPEQFHASWSTPEEKNHRIVVRYEVL